MATTHQVATSVLASAHRIAGRLLGQVRYPYRGELLTGTTPSQLWTLRLVGLAIYGVLTCGPLGVFIYCRSEEAAVPARLRRGRRLG